MTERTEKDNREDEEGGQRTTIERAKKDDREDNG